MIQEEATSGKQESDKATRVSTIKLRRGRFGCWYIGLRQSMRLALGVTFW